MGDTGWCQGNKGGSSGVISHASPGATAAPCKGELACPKPPSTQHCQGRGWEQGSCWPTRSRWEPSCRAEHKLLGVRPKGALVLPCPPCPILFFSSSFPPSAAASWLCSTFPASGLDSSHGRRVDAGSVYAAPSSVQLVLSATATCLMLLLSTGRVRQRGETHASMARCPLAATRRQWGHVPRSVSHGRSPACRTPTPTPLGQNTAAGAGPAPHQAHAASGSAAPAGGASRSSWL